jgi:glyoxylase-like metal-dependent hydrolase (beta-lactamase superfamily II)
VGPRRADPSRIDQDLVDAAELPFADGLQVIHTPGHTAGQTSFLLSREGGDVLIAGDAAARAGSGRVGPPTGALFGMYTEDIEQANRSFRKLAALEFEVAVFGHGNPVLSKAVEEFRRSVARLPA